MFQADVNHVVDDLLLQIAGAVKEIAVLKSIIRQYEAALNEQNAKDLEEFNKSLKD